MGEMMRRVRTALGHCSCPLMRFESGHLLQHHFHFLPELDRETTPLPNNIHTRLLLDILCINVRDRCDSRTERSPES